MISIISDSHVPRRADAIPEEFLQKLKESELTVHCGDFVGEEVKEMLEDLTELKAVKGNCDFFDLPNSVKFVRGGIRFGVYHGSGITPRGHHPTLIEFCNKMDVDVLLHGHTHQMEAVKKEEKILLNPGSCTGVGGGSAKSGNPTMMEIEVDSVITDRKIELESGQLKVSEETFSL